jgi:rubrerythrin
MITSEQERILQAITTAVEMELDGKECYLAASKGSTNEAGRKLLQSLAEEEDNHRQTFERIRNAVREGRDWPPIDLETDKARDIRNTLFKTCQALGVSVNGTSSELDAVKVAIDKEKGATISMRIRPRMPRIPLKRICTRRLREKNENTSWYSSTTMIISMIRRGGL